MRAHARFLTSGALSVAGLVIGYGVIFCFYVAGLFGDGSQVAPALWEKAMRGTILLGPFLGGFLLLAFLAWRERWSSGLLPWAAGSAAVLLLARREAGILSRFDVVWVAALLLVAASASRRHPDEDEDEE